MALIDVASRMPEAEATQVLLRRAVWADSQTVRAAACEALKRRPMHAYVPQLIEAMPNSVKTRFSVLPLANGTVIHEHEVEFRGKQGTQVFSYESTVYADAGMAQRVIPWAVGNEVRKAATIERRVAATESANRKLRERLEFVLHSTTGFESPDDPLLWEKQYDEYYGREAPEPSGVVQKFNVSEQAGYVSLPSAPAAPSAPTGPVAPSQPAPRYIFTHHECFAAGTPVMTWLGERPIESIQAGDRVLSQNPVTGELAYKVVQNQTLRCEIKIIKLQCGSETIRATHGHPFWVVGHGWQLAGHLEVGARIRGLDQDFTVDAIEIEPSQEVYNLLVSDFATFFVGKQCLLVHDDSPLEDIAVLVPGLAATVVGHESSDR